MIELKYRKTNADCTLAEDVILHGEYCTIGFVVEILEREEFKNGCFEIMSEKYKPYKSCASECYKIEYENDEIVEAIIESDKLSKDDIRSLMLTKVKRADANGGWNGNWDFKLYV